MIKASTLKTFIKLQKYLLVAVIILASAFVQPGNAGAGKLSPAGVLAKAVKCYPNPAISFVNFEFPSEYVGKNYSVKVYSFTGKKMYEMNVSSAKATITFTNEFYRGIYVYQLQDKAGKIIETGKFQVAR